ncbi:unnamed protein product [Anisakis simplex]|uniref:Vacuolar protein sorting-associated protein 16 homolog n=1 Tax=Anisakis simplex TaxID=6269 RepID=A0A0M3JW85_ANISI|nr:unnamed protein product [Anisakis simplex]
MNRNNFYSSKRFTAVLMGSELQDWVYLDTLKLRKDVIFKRSTRFGARESSLFASAPYGGPIAVANSSSNASSWEITVETCSGKQLSSIRVPNLHALYWSRCHRVSRADSSSEISVAESRIFYGSAGSTGLAVLTDTNRIFAVNSIMEAVPWRIPDIYRSSRPTAWNILISNTQITVLFVMGDTFYAGMQGVAPQSLNVQWKLTNGEYREIVPNCDCTRIAFAHSSGVIQVVDFDFCLLSSIKIPTVNPTTSAISPIHWCGNEALALRRSRSSLQMLSLTSEYHTYTFNSDIRLDVELDGIKVFTSDRLIFLSFVPEEVENVLGIASSEPGAILYEASEKLSKGSHGVYNYFKMIETQLDKAVHQCLFAAAHQFDHSMQKRLLRAASLGNALLQRHDPSQFVDLCHVMRILNSVRQPYVGMSLSFLQSNELKVETLIDRLIDMGMWPIAMSIAEYMKRTAKDAVHRVLAHWALSKIDALKSEKESGKIPDYAGVSESIVKRFSNYPEVSFADVAMKAVDAGLSPMAELLLEKETRLNRQIDMLLKLNKVDKALAKAAYSNQPDLCKSYPFTNSFRMQSDHVNNLLLPVNNLSVHVVIAHLRRTKTKEVIDQLMLKIPQAMCLYQDYLRDEAPAYVLALYEVDDDFARQAIYHLRQSETMPWNPFDIKEKVDEIAKAEQCLHNLRESAMTQQLDDSIMLLRLCENLDGKADFTDVNRTSVRSVFIWAAGHDDESLMEQYCLWKIEGLASQKKWHHLETYSKTKKLPVGLMPFIEACTRHGNTSLAAILVEKLTSTQETIDAYLLIECVIHELIGIFKNVRMLICCVICFSEPIKAAKLAADKKLVSSVESIHARYRMNTDVAAEVGAILSKLRAS